MATLGLVFTIGVSLEQWEKQGLLDREKLIYEKHLKEGHFEKIIWFTYGKNDLTIYNQLINEGRLDKRIIIVEMPKWFLGKHKSLIYSYLIPFVHWKECKKLDIIKTNQMGGAWTAAIIHKIYNVPFLLRTGYTYSTNIAGNIKDDSIRSKKCFLYLKYIRYIMLEKKLYRRCNVATVSSKHDKEYICKKYGIASGKICVIGNYIDHDLFKNMKEKNRQERFVYVGRLSEEKNLFNIVTAANKARIGIDIYGKGELKNSLEKYILKNHIDARLMGVVDNIYLPKVLNQYRYFVLASKHEGMPKALLEALACGLLCVGTDVEGINEVIKDGDNGILAEGIDAKALCKAMIMIQNEDVQKKILENIDNEQKINSLETILDKEWQKILEIM